MNRLRVAVLVGVALMVFAYERYASRRVEVAPAPVAAEMRDAAPEVADAEDARDVGPLDLALEDEPPFGNDVHRAVCGKRGDCRVLKITPAGVTADARTRELVTVAPFPVDAAAKATPERNYDDATVEHWMLLRKGGVLVARQWLVHDFEYAYSAVEDEPLAGVRLLPTRFEYTERWKGLSRFTGTYTTEIDLDRLVVTRFSGLSYDRLEGGEVSMRFDVDYDSLRLRRTHFEPNCAIGAVTDPKTGEVVRPRPAAFEVQWDAVPRLTRVHAITATEPLDACAPNYDGSHAGFLRVGKADAFDASFRAVLVDDSLLVDVIDDTVVDRDVLEVWTAKRSGHYGLRCEPPYEPLTPAVGTEIVLATGATRSLAGPIAPGIRVTRAGDRVRVLVPLDVAHDTYSDDWPALAIVLRDSDDNVTHERVITTTKGFANRLVDLGEPGESIGCRRTPAGLARDHATNPIRPLIGRFE